MTGQVKEDIIARWGELGILVRQGAIRFHPILLRREEFLSEARGFVFLDVHGEKITLDLGEGSLGFTYCQLPVIYHLSEEPRMVLHHRDGTSRSLPGLVLDLETSRHIFERSGMWVRLDVWLSPGL